MKLVSMAVLFIFMSTRAFARGDQLKAIIQSYARSGITIGMSVHDTKTGKELFTYNADKGMNPASTMKVVTSVASLTYLLGTFEFKTPIYTDSLSGGVAHNLYIKGMGDPSIVEERLWRIAKDLSVRGVKKVSGDIVIDNSYFDGKDFAGKEGVDNTRAYNASLSALAVNFNSFAVVGKNYGGPGGLEVHIDPPIDYFSFTSKVGGAGSGIGISRTFKDGKEYVTASGGVSTEKVKYANVQNPVQYAGSTIKWVLSQVGIEVTGKVREGKVAGTKIFEDKSKPLSLILRDLNKFSNNFTAEMILKTLSAIKAGEPGSTEKGAKILNDFVANNLGVNHSEFSIFNGSGLSRNNRVSPNTLTQALLAAYSNPKIRIDFMSSLSIGGEDGTLRSRMKQESLRGNVKAKTGTLNDVCSLSGYLDTKKKSTIAFTVIVNGAGAGSGGYFPMQEKLLMDIYNSF